MVGKNTDKSEKSDKSEKLSKSGPNNLTIKAGLTFNINTVKNKLKDYYNQNSKAPMFSHGQIAITAVLEKLYELILRECVKTIGKDKSGLKLVNRDGLQHSIILHEEFKQYYLMKLTHFEKDQLYKDQLPISIGEMDKVMERVESDLSLTSKAKNLLCFFLLKAFLDIASTCHQFLEFSKRKSLDANCVMYSIRNKFPDGLAHELCCEVTTVMKAFGEDIEDKNAISDEDNIDDLNNDTEKKDEEIKQTEQSKEKRGQSPKKGSVKDDHKTQSVKKNINNKKTTLSQIDADEEEVEVDDNEEEEEEQITPKKIVKKPTPKAKSVKK